MNYSHRCRYACVLALIFLGSLSAHAQHGSGLGDAPMLLDINATESQSLQNTRWHALHADAVIAAQRVHLNTDALKFYTPLPSKSTDGLKQFGPIMVGQSLRMALPGLSKQLNLTVDRVSQPAPGVVSYSGAIDGSTDAIFSFSIQGDRMLGKIAIGQASYIIEPAPDDSGLHDVIMLDQGLLLQTDDTLVVDSTGIGSSQTRSGTGSGDVRVLFLFANNVNNQAMLASQIVTEFNDAILRSGITASNKITFAGLISVQSSFSGQCSKEVIDNMGNRSVPLDQIDLWLDNNSADIAILITKTDNTIDCTPTSSINFGRIGGFAFSFDSSKPFATSTDTFALGDLTAIHELGHVMGGLHADTINPTIESFTAGLGAHGFENDNAGQWQTIMGGYSTSRCIFDIHNPVPQQDCTRIWYFSNPIMSAIVNGQAVYIGTSQNDGGSNGDGGQRIADMQSWLETSGMPIVSGYNTDIVPPSIAPNLNVQSEHCFGFNTASWNAISSADSYELYKSLSSSFTFPAKIFTGTSLVTTVNVPQGQTWYLRVKACNAGGCSGFSNQRAASAIASCL